MSSNMFYLNICYTFLHVIPVFTGGWENSTFVEFGVQFFLLFY